MTTQAQAHAPTHTPTDSLTDALTRAQDRLAATGSVSLDTLRQRVKDAVKAQAKAKDGRDASTSALQTLAHDVFRALLSGRADLIRDTKDLFTKGNPGYDVRKALTYAQVVIEATNRGQTLTRLPDRDGKPRLFKLADGSAAIDGVSRELLLRETSDKVPAYSGMYIAISEHKQAQTKAENARKAQRDGINQRALDAYSDRYGRLPETAEELAEGAALAAKRERDQTAATLKTEMLGLLRRLAESGTSAARIAARQGESRAIADILAEIADTARQEADTIRAAAATTDRAAQDAALATPVEVILNQAA